MVLEPERCKCWVAGCCCKWGVLFVGVLMIRAVQFWGSIFLRASGLWKSPLGPLRTRLNSGEALARLVRDHRTSHRRVTSRQTGSFGKTPGWAVRVCNFTWDLPKIKGTQSYTPKLLIQGPQHRTPQCMETPRSGSKSGYIENPFWPDSPAG